MNDEEITRLRALADAAAPGPWRTEDSGVEGGSCSITNDWITDRGSLGQHPDGQRFNIYDEGGHSPADAEFIAAAREAVPALLDEVANLERALIDRKVSHSDMATLYNRACAERDEARVALDKAHDLISRYMTIAVEANEVEAVRLWKEWMATFEPLGRPV